MRASDQGYLSFVALLFDILKAWKCDSSSVMRPSAQGYVTTGGPYFDALKIPFCRVEKPRAQGYMASSENLYNIFPTRKCDYSSFMGNVVNINIKTSKESLALTPEDIPLRTLPPSGNKDAESETRTSRRLRSTRSYFLI